MLRALAALACWFVSSWAVTAGAQDSAPASAPAPNTANIDAAASSDPASVQQAASVPAPAQPGAARASDAALTERLRILEAQVAELTAARGEPAAAPPPSDAELLSALAPAPEVSAKLLDIYGFFDTGFQYIRLAHPTASGRPFVGEKGFSFALGGLNLYIDASPDEHWRALVEMRYSLYPQGEEKSFEAAGISKYERVDNRTYDSSSSTGRNVVIWSGLVLERAWGQWQPKDWFKLRTGLLLTPYGIWNVDHGAPTLIFLSLPEFFASEYFPTRQIGAEAHGSVLKGFWELGYHLTVSNGRFVATRDLDRNKALGGRIFAKWTGKHRLQLGGSWYFGDFGDKKKVLTSLSPFTVDDQVTYSGKEYALGLDASADLGHFRIRAEGVHQRIQYDNGRRAPGRAPGTLVADDSRWDGYVAVAYTRPDLHIEPFILQEIFRRNAVTSGANTGVQSSVGLNVLITPRVSVKNQFSIFRFYDLAPSKAYPDATFYYVTSRLVVAF